MVDAYISGDAELEERMLQSIPMRRFADPMEIAHAALFLASDEAGFIQGHTLVLDGGITII
jgi:NAD(P)-dependent dehydrogenase (short-subunit alcohol dehydrogenase family)